ncbi:MAG: RNA-binding S4 domain-containing protein [Malacoplasma sp.]
MSEDIFFIIGEYIKLGQLIKCLNFINSGAEAKYYLNDKKVYVNGILENRRGKKIFNGDEIIIENKKIRIMEKKNEFSN